MPGRAEKIRFTLLFLALAGCFLFAGESTNAESPPFKIYSTQEGIAHDNVNKIVRDSHGFLWFCTAEGLSRFDGTRFTNFTQDQGLPHRNVTDFLETREGNYLIGTSVGIVAFDPNGKPYRWNVLESRLEQSEIEPPMFRTFAPETDQRRKKYILALAQDAQGTVWAGTDLGLYRVINENGVWKFIEFDLGSGLQMNFLDLLPDSNGGLIVAASSGVFRIVDGKAELVDQIGADSVMQAKDGEVWIGAGGEDVGLRVFRFERGKLRFERVYTTKDGLLTNGFQFTLAQLSNGKIYIGQALGALEFLPEAKNGEPKFRQLTTDAVYSMVEDSVGDLWLGTELKGAWKLAHSGFSSFGEKEGLSASVDIRSIYFNKKGEIFLPTRPREILHKVAGGKFEGVTPHGLQARSWGGRFLDFESQTGEWWIPAADGLRRYPKTRTFADLSRTSPKKVYTAADGLFGNEIFNLFEDSRGDIWITIIGEVENTLSRWDKKTDTIVSYSSELGIPISNGAIAFAEDKDGDIWFGNYFGSLMRFRDGKFRVFDSKDGMPESQIDDLLTDAQGRLWIATTGRGIFRIDDTSTESPVFKSISTYDGLSSNQVICLTADRFNQIYAGTGRGVNRIDQNGKITVYTQADGLPSNYITRCAADSDGNLWFVSRNTLVRFLPEMEKAVNPPQVFIDKISVNGIAQKISAMGETKIELGELASNQNQIQIDFFALTFGAGENIKYQYLLDGQDWSNPTNQQTVNLDLATGQHYFEVRALRFDGVAGERTAIATFQIRAPIWARTWFILLCIFGAAVIIFGIHRYRTTNLRAINSALEEARLAEEKLRKSRDERLAELEKVRSRIATDLHDDIGASLTQIAILSEVAQAQSKGNGVTDPLTKISFVSNELVGTMSDIVWSINPAKDHLSDLTQRMRRFASDILSAKGIVFQFTLPAASKEITVNANVRREVFLIFKESISNIVKHSEAKNVGLKLDVSDNTLMLEISDDGKGFATDKFFENSLSSFELGGNGISNMQKRAKEMMGRLDVSSKIGFGTIIKLSLPMEQKLEL